MNYGNGCSKQQQITSGSFAPSALPYVMIWVKGNSLLGHCDPKEPVVEGERGHHRAKESFQPNGVCCQGDETRPPTYVIRTTRLHYFQCIKQSIGQWSSSRVKQYTAMTQWFINSIPPAAVTQLLSRCCLYQFRSECIVCQQQFGNSFFIPGAHCRMQQLCWMGKQQVREWKK